MPVFTSNSPVSVSAPVVPRLRLPKLCVAIQATSPVELIERAEAALADSKFIELRLDSLSKPSLALPKIKEFLAAHRDVAAIGHLSPQRAWRTLRAVFEIGDELLTAAADAGCRVVDFEIESAEEPSPASSINSGTR